MSKKSNARPSAVHYRLLADELDMTKMQNGVLRTKNLNLAKRLAEKEIECSQAIKLALEQRNSLIQQEFIITNYREKFSRILSSISSTSVHLANVGQECSDVLQGSRAGTDLLTVTTQETTSPSPNKTQTVMPMVGGHIILKPTIVLPRVPRKHLEMLMDENEDVETSDADSDENGQPETEEESEVAQRLNTLTEEDSTLQLSGLQKDVKVSVTPSSPNSSDFTVNNDSSLLRASTSHTRENSSIRGRNSYRNETSLGTSTEVSTMAEGDENTKKDFVLVERPAKKMRESLPDSTTFGIPDLSNSYQTDVTNDEENSESMKSENTTINITTNGFNQSLDNLSIVDIEDEHINNTSTPYRTPVHQRNKRRREEGAENKENHLVVPETPSNVTKRRQKKARISHIQELMVSKQFPDCTVAVERMPASTVAGILTTNRTSTSNSVKATPTANKSKISTGSTGSIDSGRPRRSKAPVSLKEPSMRTKMRRSK